METVEFPCRGETVESPSSSSLYRPPSIGAPDAVPRVIREGACDRSQCAECVWLTTGADHRGAPERFSASRRELRLLRLFLRALTTFDSVFFQIHLESQRYTRGRRDKSSGR